MLTSLANIHEQLGIATSVTGDDAFLTNLIIRASYEIEHLCSRVFESGTYDEWHQVPVGSGVIYADQSPVTAINTFTVAAFPNQVETALAASAYFIDPNNKLGRILLMPWALAFPASTQQNAWPDEETDGHGKVWVHLKYDAGMNPIDPDIEQICLQYVVTLYKMRDVNLILASERVTSYAYSLRAPNDFQDWLNKQLMQHRKPVMM